MIDNVFAMENERCLFKRRNKHRETPLQSGLAPHSFVQDDSRKKTQKKINLKIKTLTQMNTLSVALCIRHVSK